MHGTLKRTKRTRSAVTSGRRLFPDRLDMRSSHGRRFKDLVSLYIEQAGGEDRITQSQRALIRDVALLQTQLEDLQAEYAQSGRLTPKDRLEYQRLANSMRRHMRDAGLTRDGIKEGREDDIPSPLEYANRSRRQRLDEDND
ncbi:hypothetical protein [Bradyrhizobium guangzhouense]|uniref:hypothetical protein n=1 Tax=Bradyrhizobium guangzhouense TaxID=1325095 RepID=UPI001009C130|nr:hypothetical protein [Bradyrhizobium guangzhouense]RXH05694.1 hypothetical protein EAS54_38980 [Bradyrhizobium guangzhouense]